MGNLHHDLKLFMANADTKATDEWRQTDSDQLSRISPRHPCSGVTRNSGAPRQNSQVGPSAPPLRPMIHPIKISCLAPFGALNGVGLVVTVKIFTSNFLMTCFRSSGGYEIYTKLNRVYTLDWCKFLFTSNSGAPCTRGPLALDYLCLMVVT